MDIINDKINNIKSIDSKIKIDIEKVKKLYKEIYDNPNISVNDKIRYLRSIIEQLNVRCFQLVPCQYAQIIKFNELCKCGYLNDGLLISNNGVYESCPYKLIKDNINKYIDILLYDFLFSDEFNNVNEKFVEYLRQISVTHQNIAQEIINSDLKRINGNVRKKVL